MVLDTSAVLAILQDEPERRAFTEALEAADTRAMSTANFVESSIVLEARYGPDGVRDFDLLLWKAQISLVPLDVEQAHLARQAYRRFGNGNHRASLNLGDCFAYALARSLGEPLLFKGDDFRHSDVPAHPASA